jgi:hypothetical protein
MHELLVKKAEVYIGELTKEANWLAAHAETRPLRQKNRVIFSLRSIL